MTINSDGDVKYDDWWDIILVPPTKYISLCLLNTGRGVPFISSLELRPMPNSIYDAGPYMALDVHRRYDAGHNITNNLKRYKNDVYDRLWRELLNEYLDCEGVCINITSASAIDVVKSNNLYKPPPELLRTAARAPNKTYQLGFHKDVSNAVLILKSLTWLPIVDGEIQFSIGSINQSGLPPIVNGIEIFRVIEFSPGVLTDSQDVDAIMDIKETYKLIRKWRGDPCVNSSWDGVSCNMGDIPRIITLNLNSSSLTGGIAPSIFNLTALQYLDLSNNTLAGPIPEFLASLSSLKFLNLAGNNLSGSVPKALLQKSISGLLMLRLDNNTNLCSLDSCNNGNISKKWPIIPVVASASIFLLLVIALVIWGILKIKAMKKVNTFKSENLRFTHSEIAVITENFKTILGEGGFGKVYLGTMVNGRKIAVKSLSSESKQGAREFSQEIKLLMRVHHGNVVSLVGYCDNPKNMALIYEYMPNGNLKHLLSSGDNEGVYLSWRDRIQIAVHSAQGLDYLHNSCVPKIIHCDLKTSNILLDENKQAKLADFGLSRAFKHDDATHITVTYGAGTPGYIDPALNCRIEATPKFSRRSDMYSFGVILLELVTRKPALIEDGSLLDWVLPRYNEGDIESIVDERLYENYSIDEARNLLILALSCLNKQPNERPGINEVLTELKQCLAKENIRCGTTFTSKSNYKSAGSSSIASIEPDFSQLTAR
ncbi:hypothetical protein QQ045_016938 [Rhodiola kirilowii]